MASHNVVRTCFNGVLFSAAIIAGVVFLLSMNSVTWAGTYKYHPGTSFSLGFGFEPKAPLTTFVNRCLKFTRKENFNTDGAGQMRFNSKIIHSQEELYSELGISVTLDAHYGFFSGGSSLASNSSFSSSADSLTWMIKAEIIFGDYLPDDEHEIVLTDDAKALIKQPSKFTEKCGSEFVAQETRGGRAVAIFTATNLSSNMKETLAASLNASFSPPGSGGTLNAEFKKALARVRKSAIVTLDIVTEGGPGPSALRDAIVDIEDLPAIKETLVSYIAAMTPANAVPFQVTTASYKQFGLEDAGTVFVNRDNTLTLLNGQYQSVWSVFKRLVQYNQPLPDAPETVFIISDEERLRLDEWSKHYQKKAKEIFSAAKKCLLKEEDCETVLLGSLPQVKFPAIPGLPEIFPIRQCFDASPAGEGAGILYNNFGIVGKRELISRVVVDYASQENLVALTDDRPGMGPPGGGTRCIPFEFDMSQASAFANVRLVQHSDSSPPILTIIDRLGRRNSYVIPVDRFGAPFLGSSFGPL